MEKVEFFKKLVGYEDKYIISNYGRIISLPRKVGNYHNEKHEMKQFKNKSGYLKVSLTDKNGKKRNVFVHRLVALTFIDNPNNYPCINHKDGDKTNNRIMNLEWCDNKMNNEHSYKMGLRKTRKVAQYDEKGNLIKVYRNCHQASIKTGIDYHAIWLCLHGVYKYVGGSNWYYVDTKPKQK